MTVWVLVPGWPGHRSAILGDFIRNDYIAIGEPGTPSDVIGDLTNVPEDEFEKLFREIYGDYPSLASAIKAVRYEMQVGDIVIVASDGYIYGVGEIVGDYQYREEYIVFRGTERYVGREEALRYFKEGEFVLPLYPHRRPVRWLKIAKLPYRSLPRSIREKLSAPRKPAEMIVMKLKEEDRNVLKSLLTLWF